MRRVFVCSPYRGDVSANTAFASQVCREVALAGGAPFAPHLLFPRWLDDEVPAEREAGIAAGLAWLEVADEMLVAGQVTSGMRREIEAASDLGIPITFRPQEHLMTDIHETLAILAENDGTTRREEFPYLFDPRHLARGFRRLAEGAETAVLELLDPPTRTEVKRIEVEAEARLGAIAGYGDDGGPDDDYVLIAPATTSGRFRVRWRTADVHGQAGAEVERHGVTITEAATLLFTCLPRIERYDFDIVPMEPVSWAEHQGSADRMARSDLWVADRRGTISVRLQIPVGEA